MRANSIQSTAKLLKQTWTVRPIYDLTRAVWSELTAVFSWFCRSAIWRCLSLSSLASASFRTPASVPDHQSNNQSNAVNDVAHWQQMIPRQTILFTRFKKPKTGKNYPKITRWNKSLSRIWCTLLIETNSVREYVFYVFFRFQKRWLLCFLK